MDFAEIRGITFYDNAQDCISQFEKAPWISRALSLIQSFGTLFTYSLSKIGSLFGRVSTPYMNADNLFKQKLVVCIHGLNNNPTQFASILNEMEKQDLSDIDIYTPTVLEKGNAKLDDMVKPILAEITKWALTEGDKELVLVGISNGGRISRAIEAELTKSGNQTNLKKIHFVSIVGACKGSVLSTLANKAGLSFFMSKNIAEEMPTESARIEQLDIDWNNGLKFSPEIVREYSFIASPHDWQVPNYNSTLMYVPHQKTRYALIQGHGHNSIVNATAQAIAALALKPNY